MELSLGEGFSVYEIASHHAADLFFTANKSLLDLTSVFADGMLREVFSISLR
jgi:hypothetical protein